MTRTAVALLLLTAVAGAQTVWQPPRPDGKKSWITDAAAVIQPDDRDLINSIAGTLLREKQVPLVVVTVPGLGGDSVERYATVLFNAWRIGTPKRDYGMLLLVSTGDRRARIELGAAWGRDGDADSRRIMDTLIIPHFKAGDYSKGILEGVRGLNALARGDSIPSPVRPAWWWPLWMAVGALAIGVLVSIGRSGDKGWGWLVLGILLSMAVAVLASRGSNGSFGGGSSGGGGASGSW